MDSVGSEIDDVFIDTYACHRYLHFTYIYISLNYLMFRRVKIKDLSNYIACKWYSFGITYYTNIQVVRQCLIRINLILF